MVDLLLLFFTVAHDFFGMLELFARSRRCERDFPLTLGGRGVTRASNQLAFIQNESDRDKGKYSEPT